MCVCVCLCVCVCVCVCVPSPRSSLSFDAVIEGMHSLSVPYPSLLFRTFQGLEGLEVRLSLEDLDTLTENKVMSKSIFCSTGRVRIKSCQIAAIGLFLIVELVIC